MISTRHEYVNSIFADPGAAESINNPASYHIINTASTLPYTGASYLTPEREAIFALALQSGSVAIVKINPNTEKAARVFDIKNDSFFGGLNFFSTKSRGLSQDGSILGMVVKYVKKSLYFVTLSFDGQLKCWNSEMSLVGSCDALNYCKTRNLGKLSYRVRKIVSLVKLLVSMIISLKKIDNLFIIIKILVEKKPLSDVLVKKMCQY